jgi:hypothetical protein
MGQIDVNIGDTRIIGGYNTKKVGPVLYVDCSVWVLNPIDYVKATIALK